MKNCIICRLAVILAVACLLTTATVADVMGKYVMIDNDIAYLDITIRAEFGEFKILEHKAIRLPSGEYDLLDDTAAEVDTEKHQHVTENSYALLPGLDIPKDPFIEITDKSTVPAYLYLIVAHDSLDGTGVSYELEDHWEPVDGYRGVYVYVDGEDKPITLTYDENTKKKTISIIKDNVVKVSQKLNLTGELSISFQACMKQVYGENPTAKSVYEGFQTTQETNTP